MNAMTLGAVAFAMSVSGNPPGYDQEKKAEQKSDEQQMQQQQMQHQNLGARLDSWPAESRAAAEAMIAKYGKPDEVMAKKIMWNDKGAFKRIYVTAEGVEHDFPSPHKDVIGAVIDYKVPPEKFDDLALFDGSITADRTKGTLTANCGNSEEMSFLALNLADDVIRGKKSVAQARDAMAKAAKDVAAGKPPVIAQQLQFAATKTATADPDKPATSAMGR